ncbi:hypothetical protein tb265_39230 [Gemmatimonadetes bacterium T265]|nr:hypothetical protein tb265_39230 [Gemmatimonadetes bacterium T265]
MAQPPLFVLDAAALLGCIGAVVFALGLWYLATAGVPIGPAAAALGVPLPAALARVEVADAQRLAVGQALTVAGAVLFAAGVRPRR